MKERWGEAGLGKATLKVNTITMFSQKNVGK